MPICGLQNWKDPNKEKELYEAIVCSNFPDISQKQEKSIKSWLKEVKLIWMGSNGLKHLFLAQNRQMIQRIQTVWLLLASIAFSIALIPSVLLLSSKSIENSILEDGQLQIWESHILSSGSIISVLLAFAAIFLYKTRPNQILIASLSALCQIAMVLLSSFYMCYKWGVFDQMKLDFGVFSGFSGVFLVWLAARAIRKDDEKVKSMDRLR